MAKTRKRLSSTHKKRISQALKKRRKGFAKAALGAGLIVGGGIGAREGLKAADKQLDTFIENRVNRAVKRASKGATSGAVSGAVEGLGKGLDDSIGKPSRQRVQEVISTPSRTKQAFQEGLNSTTGKNNIGRKVAKRLKKDLAARKRILGFSTEETYEGCTIEFKKRLSAKHKRNISRSLKNKKRGGKEEDKPKSKSTVEKLSSFISSKEFERGTKNLKRVVGTGAQIVGTTAAAISIYDKFFSKKAKTKLNLDVRKTKNKTTTSNAFKEMVNQTRRKLDLEERKITLRERKANKGGNFSKEIHDYLEFRRSPNAQTRRKISRSLKGKRRRRRRAVGGALAGLALGGATITALNKVASAKERSNVKVYKAGQVSQSLIDSMRDRVSGSKPDKFLPLKGERGKSRKLKTNKRGFRNVRAGFISKRSVSEATIMQRPKVNLPKPKKR